MEKSYNKYYNPKVNQKAVAKYNSKSYDRIEVKVFKGQKDFIKNYADSKGMSLNAYINSLISADMGDLLPPPTKDSE